MEAVPGVRAVTFSQGVPPRGGSLHMNIRPEADGLPPPPIAGLEMPELTVAPDYFRTLGVPLVAGRNFTPADGEDAIIVNTVLARRVWGDASPLGRRVRMDARKPWKTVIGVAGDVKVTGPADAMGEGMEFYSPLPDSMRFGFFSLTIATTGDAAPVVHRLRSELKTLDPLLPNPRRLDDGAAAGRIGGATALPAAGRLGVRDRRDAAGRGRRLRHDHLLGRPAPARAGRPYGPRFDSRRARRPRAPPGLADGGLGRRHRTRRRAAARRRDRVDAVRDHAAGSAGAGVDGRHARGARPRGMRRAGGPCQPRRIRCACCAASNATRGT